MARPILRRLFLSFAVLLLFSTLLRKLHCRTPKSYSNKSVGVELTDFRTANLVNNSVPDTGAFSPDHTQDAQSNHVDTNLSLQLYEYKLQSALMQLTQCPLAPNRFTNHIRLPNLLFNISMSGKTAMAKEKHKFWNPTIIALPRGADNQYVLPRLFF